MSKPITLFLVDDHMIFAQSFGAYISTCLEFSWKGHATGGGHTLKQILQGQPDLLLLDFHLKEQNGLELLKELREKGYQNFIVFLTMNRDKAIFQAAKTQGANGFVSKEADAEALVAGLRQLVQGDISFLDLLTVEKSAKSNPFKLTPQEQLIAELICSGISSENVAQQLQISIHTVHTHRRRILTKTGAANFMQVCQKLA